MKTFYKFAYIFICFYLICNFLPMHCMEEAKPPVEVKELKCTEGIDPEIRKQIFEAGLRTLIFYCIVTKNRIELATIPNHWQIFYKGISVMPEIYLKRLRSYLFCPDECYALALIYILRLAKNYGYKDPIDQLSFHRIFLAAMVLAIKWWDDSYYSNKYYAEVGGISTEEIDAMELQLFANIRFELFVSMPELQKMLEIIMILGEKKILAEKEYKEYVVQLYAGAE